MPRIDSYPGSGRRRRRGVCCSLWVEHPLLAGPFIQNLPPSNSSREVGCLKDSGGRRRSLMLPGHTKHTKTPVVLIHCSCRVCVLQDISFLSLAGGLTMRRVGERAVTALAQLAMLAFRLQSSFLNCRTPCVGHYQSAGVWDAYSGRVRGLRAFVLFRRCTAL